MDTHAIEDDVQVKYFRRELLKWWESEGRVFPWRETRDPYQVLVAELMLRRTRAEQVRGVYLQFIERYPTIDSLAAADSGDVARILYSLGLAWRVPAFRQTARAVVESYGGKLPSNRQALMCLPGIGDYVADAILSFAFDVPAAVVDTNTVRVAGRYLGFSSGGEARRRRTVIDSVRGLVGTERTRDMNFAVLDLGALVCRAKEPVCERCPVRARCVQAAPEEKIEGPRTA